MKNRIKQVRKSQKLTQAEFGNIIGVRGNTVTGYETGLRNPTNVVIRSICREFGINEEWLRTGNGSMTVPNNPDLPPEGISQSQGESRALGDRIRKIRNHYCLSQEEFSEKIDLSKNYIWMLEKGERIPSTRTIKDICREFLVNEKWLRTGTGDMIGVCNPPAAVHLANRNGQNIGDRIKEVRKNSPYGKTQETFAQYLGISKQNVSSYELGRRTPSSAAINLICERCQVDEEWLRNGDGGTSSSLSTENFTQKSIGDRILTVINFCHLSRVEFADALKITPAYVSKITNKGAIPSNRLIDDICEKFGVNEKWLLNGTGDMIQNNDPIPTPEEQDEDLQKIIYKYSMLLPADKKLLADFIDRFI